MQLQRRYRSPTRVHKFNACGGGRRYRRSAQVAARTHRRQVIERRAGIRQGVLGVDRRAQTGRPSHMSINRGVRPRCPSSNRSRSTDGRRGSGPRAADPGGGSADHQSPARPQAADRVRPRGLPPSRSPGRPGGAALTGVPNLPRARPSRARSRTCRAWWPRPGARVPRQHDRRLSHAASCALHQHRFPGLQRTRVNRFAVGRQPRRRKAGGGRTAPDGFG